MMTRGWQRWAFAVPGALAAVLALGACDDSSTSTSSGGSSSGNTTDVCGGAQTCRIARDCGGGNECRVPDGGGEGCCVKIVCTSNDDCAPPAECDIRRGLCVVPTCDPSNPADCPSGQRCINTTVSGVVTSQCQDVTTMATVATCGFDATRFSLRAGETRKLSLVGYATSGAQIPYASVTLTSSDMAVATVAADGTVTAVAAGTATITGAATTACTSTVQVYGAVPTADVRAVVFDNRTGAAISGAKVQLRKTGGGAPVVVDTDANGEATFTAGGPAADVLDISAFSNGHTWVTYTQPASNDVAFYLDPLIPTATVAGVTGNFDTSSAQPPTGDIKLGLAAFSIAGALSDLNLLGLIGKSVPTDIVIPSINVNQMDVPLPSGVYLKLSSDDIKGRIDMYADGPCTTANPCKRILWGLGGQVALSKIGPIIQNIAGGTGDINAAAILSAVLPFFRKFYHYAQGGISVTDITAPVGDAFPAFTQTVTVKPNFLLQKSAKWNIPALPPLPNDPTKSVTGALVLQGSLVPGQGFVPLGLTAGLDACESSSTADCTISPTADGRISCADDPTTTTVNECEGVTPGDVIVDYAPPHDGLEGYPFGTVAVALDINSLGGGDLFTSVLVAFNDQLSAGTNTFSPASFLAFNKGAWNQGTRTYSGTSRITGADFYRLNLGDSDAQWFVFFNTTSDTFSVEAPPVPAGVTGDRVGSADIQGFRLFTGADKPANFTALVGFTSTNFDNLVNYTGAFSTQACAPIYPARDCTGNNTCAAGFDDTYTCDTTAGVCVNDAAGVTAKGAGACAAGTRELMTGTAKAVCSRIPSCEQQ